MIRSGSENSDEETTNKKAKHQVNNYVNEGAHEYSAPPSVNGSSSTFQKSTYSSNREPPQDGAVVARELRPANEFRASNSSSKCSQIQASSNESVYDKTDKEENSIVFKNSEAQSGFNKSEKSNFLLQLENSDLDFTSCNYEVNSIGKTNTNILSKPTKVQSVSLSSLSSLSSPSSPSSPSISSLSSPSSQHCLLLASQAAVCSAETSCTAQFIFSTSSTLLPSSVTTAKTSLKAVTDERLPLQPSSSPSLPLQLRCPSSAGQNFPTGLSQQAPSSLLAPQYFLLPSASSFTSAGIESSPPSSSSPLSLLSIHPSSSPSPPPASSLNCLPHNLGQIPNGALNIDLKAFESLKNGNFLILVLPPNNSPGQHLSLGTISTQTHIQPLPSISSQQLGLVRHLQDEHQLFHRHLEHKSKQSPQSLDLSKPKILSSSESSCSEIEKHPILHASESSDLKQRLITSPEEQLLLYNAKLSLNQTDNEKADQCRSIEDKHSKHFSNGDNGKADHNITPRTTPHEITQSTNMLENQVMKVSNSFVIPLSSLPVSLYFPPQSTVSYPKPSASLSSLSLSSHSVSQHGSSLSESPSFALVLSPPSISASMTLTSLSTATSSPVATSLQAAFASTSPTAMSSVTTTSPKQFTCHICGKMYNSEKYLSMHVSIHNPSNSAFQQNPLVEKKRNSQQDEAEIYCQTGSLFKKPHVACNPPFDVPPSANFKIPPQFSNDVQQLAINGNNSKNKTSIKSNAGASGQWKCRLCDKLFAQNSNYKNHMRTHSNERPYVCELCSIGFKERYHLKKHVLFKHSDEAKEQCRVCGKRFKDSTAVRAHERTHSSDRPYSCPRCLKSFKTSECLWHHENRSKTCGKISLNAVKSEAVTNVESYPLAHEPEQKISRRKKSNVQVHQDDIIEELPSIPLGTQNSDNYAKQLNQLQYSTNANFQKSEQQHNRLQQRQPQQQQQQQQLYYVQQQNVYNSMSQSQMNDLQFVTNEQKVFQQLQSHQKGILNHHYLDVKSSPNSELQAHNSCDFLPMDSSPQNSAVVMYNLNSNGNFNLTSWNMSFSNEEARNANDTFEHSNGSSICHQPQRYLFDRQDSSNSFVSVKFENGNFQQLTESELSNIESSLGTPSVNAMCDDKIIFGLGSSLKHQFSDGEDDGECKMIFSQNDLQVAQEEECLEERNEDNVEKETNFRGCLGVNVKSELQNPSYEYNNRENQTSQSGASSYQRHKFDQTSSSSTSPSSPQLFQQLQEQHSIQVETSESISGENSNVFESTRPFRCDVCQAGFKLKVHLKKHQLYKHSNDYPCECRICGKRFKDSSAVRLHERTHSEERPFSCECGKSFKTRENLWGHKHRGPCDFGIKGQEGKNLNPSAYRLNVSGRTAHCGSISDSTTSDISVTTAANAGQSSYKPRNGNTLQNNNQFNVSAKKFKTNFINTSHANHRENDGTLFKVKDPEIIEPEKQFVLVDERANKLISIQEQSLSLSNYTNSLQQQQSTTKYSTITSTNRNKIKPHSATTSSLSTVLPTAVVVPIKRKKAEISPPTFVAETNVSHDQSNFTVDQASGQISSVAIASNTQSILTTTNRNNTSSTDSNFSLELPLASNSSGSSQKMLHLNSSLSAPQLTSSDTRLVNRCNIAYPATMEGRELSDLSRSLVFPSNSVVLNMGVLVRTDKSILPPFESLLSSEGPDKKANPTFLLSHTQKSQLPVERQPQEQTSALTLQQQHQQRLFNLTSQSDSIHTSSVNPQIVYPVPNNARLVFRAPRSVQK